jgi:hypothetical protein
MGSSELVRRKPRENSRGDSALALFALPALVCPAHGSCRAGDDGARDGGDSSNARKLRLGDSTPDDLRRGLETHPPRAGGHAGEPVFRDDAPSSDGAGAPLASRGSCVGRDGAAAAFETEVSPK